MALPTTSSSAFLSYNLPIKAYGAQFKAFALQKSDKKAENTRKIAMTEDQKRRNLLGKEFEGKNHLPRVEEEANDGHRNTSDERITNSHSISDSPASATRSAVLKACSVTSGILLALGLLIREAAHIASVEGWLNLDSSSELSFGLEIWHIQLVFSIVVLVSSCRYMLLKIWPEFAESSEAANQKVLGSLQPLDYLLVAILPGISEEFLFRGAILPLLGLNWKSSLVVGAIFGGLHLDGSRKYSFAIWASLVGFIYGMATIVSSSIIVPMACHSLNNLVGGIIWRSASSSENKD
ncbi:hypothetical protein AXF42_Ash018385 [Apostasia shenzhenica]|uniref:CAAX prenyl protease 2/Lysostaphin resistance protein A-like domain-containing protein n=1 Tax=Apostasia shenzhenica TaxID=1088818 RepID=A0A2I0BEB3_9ASPA|nr:hypothetical protein AXF42_Ash018385 [Apostasia shenzhenica]